MRLKYPTTSPHYSPQPRRSLECCCRCCPSVGLGVAKEKGHALSLSRAWHPWSKADQSYSWRISHCLLLSVGFMCWSTPHWWPTSLGTDKEHHDTKRPNSWPAVRGQCGAAASPCLATRQPLGLECQKCFLGGRQQLPCCRC